jgi:hypothetical protein
MDGAASHPRFAFLRQHWFLLGLALLLVVFVTRYNEKISDADHQNRSAFLRWRDQLLDLDAGVNIWETYNYPNPPIMAMLLRPLMSLPPRAGAMTWFYLKVVMVLVAIHLEFRLVEDPDKPWPLWARAAAVVLSLRPILGDLSHGNVNLLILLLCVTGLWCFRRGGDWRAGGLLGLAIACKLTPALFLPYFAWKRQWKVLGGAAAGLVLFFMVVPGLCFGFERNHEFLASWYHGMIRPYVEEGMVTSEHQNQSLPGLAHRLLTDSPSFSEYEEGEGYVPVENHNIAAWDPAVARLIVRACMVLFGLVALARCRTPTTDRRSWRLAAEYGLVFLGMLLFSERTWKHHCVTLLVPVGVLAYYGAVAAPSRAGQRLALGVLAIAALLMLATATAGSPTMVRAGKLAHVYGAYTLAIATLAGGLVYVLRRPRFAVTPTAVTVLQMRTTVWTEMPQRETQPATADQER